MGKTSAVRTAGAIVAVLFAVAIGGQACAQSSLKMQPNQPQIPPVKNLQPSQNPPKIKSPAVIQPKLVPNVPKGGLKYDPKPPKQNPNPNPGWNPGGDPGWNAGWNHCPQGNLGFYVTPPSGHYEMVTENVMVEPERTEQFWVPPEYQTGTDAAGNTHTIKVRDGYMAQRTVPARYQTITRQIWVQDAPQFGVGLGFRF